MKKFRSITIPEKTFNLINELRDLITDETLSKSKVVSIIARAYIKKHEKEKPNDTPMHQKSCQR